MKMNTHVTANDTLHMFLKFGTFYNPSPKFNFLVSFRLSAHDK